MNEKKKYKFPQTVKAEIHPPDADVTEHPLKGTGMGAYADLHLPRRSVLKAQKHLRLRAVKHWTERRTKNKKR